MDKIFVQIASYRDPELIPTIKDCILKAKYPQNLTFGICWQRSEEDEWDNLEEYESNPNFTILDVPWNESRGLCWARSEIQKMWRGEKYTLQIDSHHRFAQDWDAELIAMMPLTGSKKPILTSYAGIYKPTDNKSIGIEPYKMVAHGFTPSGTILFKPSGIEGYQQLDKPVPARFVSGHYFFTYGIHCEEYKYDPNIYFAGDEISLSIRSYTLGYDLFHPHKLLVWHEYTREGRTKHWTDFNEVNKKDGKVDKMWWEMDNESKRRLRHMLQEEYHEDIDLTVYGLGTVRTHRDYEVYAGISFKNRKLHPNTWKGIDPPVNDTTEWDKIEEVEYNYELSIPPTEDFKYIYVGIEDDRGQVLYRQEILNYTPLLKVKFKSFDTPYKWVYWPVDKRGNWYNRKDTLLE